MDRHRFLYREVYHVGAKELVAWTGTARKLQVSSIGDY